ncbi:CAMK family protein kinase [Tritrichomonas foetus]|uniref:CAMK family protein kinase n=1 Tax=Tritrichomonas foetus TaxID=1144522 RepID=A0A1J4KWZ0_9EUKA|nr:CAMK family protein kinase [Tritrichomonas foetus]|eukprot:OHT15751.1 CAMK family protein kinase [Tritrichomonas foetus]
MNKSKRIDVVNSEINALVRLNHPNIIKLYDSFEENDHLFMILQLCENGTLSSIIKNSRGIDPQLLVPFMKQILSAVAFCHSQKIAHRDIKPANVFLDGYTRPLLADFGFATIIQNDALTKKFCGSFPYRSPENLQQLPHDAFKSDIWALGVTFYEMATGGSPWPTHAPDSASKAILSGSYHIPEWVPKTISGVIKKMLVVDPNSRFSAAQLLESPFLIVGSSINCSLLDNRPRINYCTTTPLSTIPLSTAPSSPTSSPSSKSKSNLQANLKLQSSVNWSRANSQATYTLTFPTQGNANQQSITQFDTSSEKGRTLICSLVNRQRLDQRVVIPGKVYLGPSKLRINRSSSIPVEKTFM